MSGSVLAAILLAIISTVLQDFSDLRMVIYSLLLIIIMIFRPQGLMGSKEISLKVFKNKRLPVSQKGEIDGDSQCKKINQILWRTYSSC